MSNYGKPFEARYSGHCADCNQPIAAGAQVRYRYNGRKELCHVGCEAAPAEPAPYTLQGGEGYGCRGWHSAQVVKVDPARYDGHSYLYVLSASHRYVREDGLSLGVGDDQGYIFTAQCRPATPEEIQPLLKAEADAEYKAEVKQALSKIKKRLRDEGERPDGINEPKGERLFDSQDICGGGDWFIVGADDEVWYCLNNGADGDDWSRNNVRTGGAGAIGWHLSDPQMARDLRLLHNEIARIDEETN